MKKFIDMDNVMTEYNYNAANAMHILNNIDVWRFLMQNDPALEKKSCVNAAE
ncbi:MAG TPA: hypothetical protein PLQ81_15405 [bacterium]|nr:hypothetical protein [bacterium]